MGWDKWAALLRVTSSAAERMGRDVTAQLASHLHRAGRLLPAQPADSDIDFPELWCGQICIFSWIKKNNNNHVAEKCFPCPDVRALEAADGGGCAGLVPTPRVPTVSPPAPKPRQPHPASLQTSASCLGAAFIPSSPLYLSLLLSPTLLSFPLEDFNEICP